MNGFLLFFFSLYYIKAYENIVKFTWKTKWRSLLVHKLCDLNFSMKWKFFFRFELKREMFIELGWENI